MTIDAVKNFCGDCALRAEGMKSSDNGRPPAAEAQAAEARAVDFTWLHVPTMKARYGKGKAERRQFYQMIAVFSGMNWRIS